MWLCTRNAIPGHHNRPMRTQSFNPGQGISMSVKLTTLLLWAAAAAIAVFWMLRFVGDASEQLPVVSPAQPVQVDAQAMAGQAPGVHQQILPHRLLATKQRFDAGDKLQQ